MLRSLFLVGSAIALSAGCTSTSKPSMMKSKEIVVGLILPLTGPNSSYGVAGKSGVDLAVLEANKSGGVLGRKVRAIYQNMGVTASDAKAAAETLVRRRDVVAVIAGGASAAALAMTPVANRAHVVMMIPAATAPEVTSVGDYVFRVCFTDPFQATAMATHARDALKAQHVAVLRDVGHQYSVRLADAFEKTFVERGGTVVAGTYAASDTDVEQTIAKLIASKPQAIYLPGYDEDVQRIIGVASALGFEGRFLGADGWGTKGVVRAAPDGTRFTTQFAGDEPRPGVTEFVQRYHKVMNEPPDANGALGYDATWALLAAIKRAGSNDREAIRQALQTFEPMNGVTGNIGFDKNGNANKRAVVVEIRSKAVHFVSAVEGPGGTPALKPGATDAR